MALFKKTSSTTDSAPATKPAAEAKVTSKKSTGRAHAVLLKPLISEKASQLHTANKYSFMVAPRATKNEIKKAVQAVYGTKPVDVNVLVVRGKMVRSGRFSGQRKNWKKAVVTLKAGDSIKVFEGI